MIEEKNFAKFFAKFVAENIGTKETDSIEEQFLNNLTKATLTLDKLTNERPEAYIQDKLIPVFKEFITKTNEIIEGEKK